MTYLVPELNCIVTRLDRSLNPQAAASSLHAICVSAPHVPVYIDNTVSTILGVMLQVDSSYVAVRVGVNAKNTSRTDVPHDAVTVDVSIPALKFVVPVVTATAFPHTSPGDTLISPIPLPSELADEPSTRTRYVVPPTSSTLAVADTLPAPHPVLLHVMSCRLPHVPE